ncbi:hypothetical protein [Stenotrophomonas maltophilia]|uniref:hypothetical protein n=1 Tax=Stenotrophomonas maltophilia TaxID=40324 RepID=UPI002E77A9D5|nr:hypothetical protein [Stenotrophomonas maltophilia]
MDESFDFDASLYEPRYSEEGLDTFAACLNARGVYESNRFALRLSPVVHELVESILAKSAAGTADFTGEELQAYSTYLHETVHWWQHKGSTSGFIRSLVYPVQTHGNMTELQTILQSLGPHKCIQDLALSGELGLLPENFRDAALAANVVTNNFMDTEFYLHLTHDPKKKDLEIYANPYFQAAGHSFLVTYGQVIGAVSELIDQSGRVLPSPQELADKLEEMAEQRVRGYYYGSPITRAPVGLAELYEGQARFIQLQFLANSSAGGLTLDEVRHEGMLDGVYGAAFKQFLKISDTPEPMSIDDPVVALFLFICDMSINPTAGFPAPIRSYDTFYLDADPGIRFAVLCLAVAKEPALRDVVQDYSAEEYQRLASRLGELSGLGNHLIDLADFRVRIEHDDLAKKLVAEHKCFQFTDRNIVLKLLTGEFISFLGDRIDHPEFFCWAGHWLSQGNIEGPRKLWLSHLSLFSDKADDDSLYPRMHPERAESDVLETFNQFFASIILYDLSRQWVLIPGPFKLDYSWLTPLSGDAGFREQVSGIFRRHYGVGLADMSLIDSAEIRSKVPSWPR